MKAIAIGAAFVGAALLATSAQAESVEDMCLRVSKDWGTKGDVSGQCACLAEKAADDPALESELRSLGDKYSSDDEAYEASSDDTKAAFDACSVNG